MRLGAGEARGMLLSGFNQEIYEKGLREEEKLSAIRNMLDLGLRKGQISGKYPEELIEKVLLETTNV